MEKTYGQIAYEATHDPRDSDWHELLPEDKKTLETQAQAVIEEFSRRLGNDIKDLIRCNDEQREEIADLKGWLRDAEHTIANSNFAELMKHNVLEEIAKARSEERERCAKLCEKAITDYEHFASGWKPAYKPKLTCEYFAERIRDLP